MIITNNELLYQGLKYLNKSKQATKRQIIKATDERTFKYMASSKLISFAGDINYPPHIDKRGILLSYDDDLYELSDNGMDLYLELRREQYDKFESRFWRLIPILISLAALAVSIYVMNQNTEQKIIIEFKNANNEIINGIQCENSKSSRN